ncbi:uncharacterized protein [Drosophila bipectinata]|uniref:uncharacterized protein n=1 Tax=Drosophila bipectinata TaxID=42026 RepID=UPI001C89B4F7|nr:uncharacterized protein LOC108132319 [Drosophila bipectinata]
MDYVDIESFRSKYSDITVTAVPTRPKREEEPPIEPEPKVTVTEQQEPRVEITRVSGAQGSSSTGTPPTSTAMMQRIKQQNAAALAYANEYKEVLAKLEYTRYMQAKIQLMTMASAVGNGAGAGVDGSPYGLMPSAITVDPNANIEDKYSELLHLLGEMKPNLAPTMMGIRAPKDRLQRDIAHARVIVRECLLILERDEQQELTVEPPSLSVDAPTSE